MKAAIIRELVLCLLVGIFPIVISYDVGGESLLNSIVKELIPSSFMMWYAMFLTVLYIAIKFVYTYFFIGNELIRGIYRGAVSILSDVADTLLGVFRVVTGVFIGVTLLWLVFEFETFGYKALNLLFVGLAGLTDLVFMSYANSYIERTWRK